jgi:hypothetical protein
MSVEPDHLPIINRFRGIPKLMGVSQHYVWAIYLKKEDPDPDNLMDIIIDVMPNKDFIQPTTPEQIEALTLEKEQCEKVAKEMWIEVNYLVMPPLPKEFQ